VLKQPAVVAALEKIKKDAIATVTSAFIKAQQQKLKQEDTPKAETRGEIEGSGDAGSGIIRYVQ